MSKISLKKNIKEKLLPNTILSNGAYAFGCLWAALIFSIQDEYNFYLLFLFLAAAGFYVFRALRIFFRDLLGIVKKAIDVLTAEKVEIKFYLGNKK